MRHEDRTSIGGVCDRFLTTEWSLVEGIQRGEDGHDALLGKLLERYWKPVFCYLYHKGLGNEKAKDLTQGFFQEVVLGRGLIQRANPTKGSFRKFLLAALEHYLQGIHRRESARKRYPRGERIALDQIDPAGLDEPTERLTAEESFNYAWLASLLDEVLAEVEADCLAHGLEVHWRVFKERVLDPIVNETAPPSLADVSHMHGVTDPAKASNMIITVNRRLQTVMRRHLRQYASSDAAVQEELEEFVQMFCRGGAG